MNKLIALFILLSTISQANVVITHDGTTASIREELSFYVECDVQTATIIDTLIINDTADTMYMHTSTVSSSIYVHSYTVVYTQPSTVHGLFESHIIGIDYTHMDTTQYSYTESSICASIQ